jgi:hypothetical protein
MANGCTVTLPAGNFKSLFRCKHIAAIITETFARS